MEDINPDRNALLLNLGEKVRKPINSVISLSNLMQQTDLKTDQLDILEDIQSYSQSIVHLLDNILDYTKIDSGILHIESVGFFLQDILDDLAKFLRAKEEEKAIEVIFKHPHSLKKALIGDPFRIQQILTCLLNNAFKYTEKGEICFDIQQISQQKNSVALSFSISDSGCGLQKGQVENLFRSLPRDSIKKDGYEKPGLGLLIVQGLLQKMNSELFLETTPGEGARFYFTLQFPLHPEKRIKTYSLSENILKKEVLIVHDNSKIATVLSDHLNELGIKTLKVSNRDDVLKKITPSDNQNLKLNNYVLFIEQNQMIPVLSDLPVILISNRNSRENEQICLKQPFIFNDVYISLKRKFAKESSFIQISQHDNAPYSGKNPPLEECKILLVEDDPLSQKMAHQVLLEKHIQVTLAQGGLEALQLAQESVFDLVLMDIQMPGINGFETTQRLRKFATFDELPVIAMTAYTTTGDRDLCFQAGMNDFIAKPIHTVELFEVITKWLIHKKSSSPYSLQREEELLIREYSISIVGINLSIALRRVRGKQNLLYQLLIDFRTDYSYSPTLLRAALAKKDWFTIKKIAHTLKGISGNLGAYELLSAARKLEVTAEEQNYHNINISIEKLEKALRPILTSIKELEESAAFKPKETKEKKGKKIIDILALEGVFAELDSLLQQGRTDYFKPLEHLKNQLQESPAKKMLQTLEKELAGFDFEDARCTLKSINQSISP